MKEFVVAGLLITPFVRHALLAALIFVPLHGLLVLCRFQKWFWHPLLAEWALYACVVALFDKLA